MKALILLFCLLLTSVISFGQSFKKQWAAFTPTNWNVEFSKDTSLYPLDKATQGYLILKNKFNTQEVSFAVYLKSDMDSIFQERVLNWISTRSCVPYPEDLRSFDFGNHYYISIPCNSCFSSGHKCEKLVKQFRKYVVEHRVMLK